MDAIRFSLLAVLFLGLCGVCVDGATGEEFLEPYGDEGLVDKEPEWFYSTGEQIKSVAISADGNYIAAGTDTSSAKDEIYLFHCLFLHNIWNLNYLLQS